MKKSLSILLSGILALNVFGYYGIFLGMQYRNDMAMLKAFDSNSYDQSREITIKVAVSIPYMPDQSNFERVNGKFEHQGEFYRLVKQRYSKDTLTVVCIRDIEHKKIDQVLTNYIKTFADKVPENSPSSKITLNFLKDYLTTAFSIRSLSSGWAAPMIRSSSTGTLVPSFTSSITHPPKKARMV